MPDPGQLISMICRTVFDLQALAPALALVMIAFALMMALAMGNSMGGVFTGLGVLGAVGIALFALVIMRLPTILSALGVPAYTCPWSI
jgi:hypothetical protein